MQQPPPPQQLLQQLLSQPQLCSQQQLFSQQAQLGSQQQPQPEPSILSNKQKPKLGLVRAMLTISAPKKFFIGHSLLYVGTSWAVDWPTSGNARCRPTPKFGSVVIDGRKVTPFSVGHFGVRGTLKGAGSRNQAGCLGGFQTVVRQHQSSQSLARKIQAGSTRRLNCRK